MKRWSIAALLLLAFCMPAMLRAQPSTTASTLHVSVIANAGSTGTTVNKLAKLNSSSQAVISATTDTDNAIGIVISNAGTTGNANIASSGVVQCAFDGTATAADFVQISSSVAGDCHDTGASTRPTSGQVIGFIVMGGVGAGTYTVQLQISSPAGTGTGTVTTTGSPANNNLARFSGATSITNGNLSGDCTTTNTLATTCLKTNGTSFGALATTTPGTGVATAAANNTNSNGGFPTESGVGSWTPAITASTTPGAPGYSIQVGSYEKIGSTVNVWFNIVLNAWTGTPAGNVTITGLPFTSTATTSDFGDCNVNTYAGTTSIAWVGGRVAPSATVITMLMIPQTGTTSTPFLTAANTGTTPQLTGHCTYHT